MHRSNDYAAKSKASRYTNCLPYIATNHGTHAKGPSSTNARMEQHHDAPPSSVTLHKEQSMKYLCSNIHWHPDRRCHQNPKRQQHCTTPRQLQADANQQHKSLTNNAGGNPASLLQQRIRTPPHAPLLKPPCSYNSTQPRTQQVPSVRSVGMTLQHHQTQLLLKHVSSCQCLVAEPHPCTAATQP